MAAKIDPEQYMQGQIAALETLVLALFLTHPDKASVARTFTNQTAKNEILGLRKTPASFREGYLAKAKQISAWTNQAQAKTTRKLPQQL